MQKSGVRSGPTGAEATHTGTRNKMREENPGPKTSTPVRSPPPARNNHLFIIAWPAMRAHPSWQRPPLGCHIFFSLFLLSTHADFYMLQLTSPLPGGISHRSTNNYRNWSNNYQRRDIIHRGGAGLQTERSRRLHLSSPQIRSEPNDDDFAISPDLDPEAEHAMLDHQNKTTWTLKARTNRYRIQRGFVVFSQS